MNRGRGHRLHGGYTITEVMIVLAVTAGMLAAVMLSFGGRQARTEFTVGVRDYEASLQNVMANVVNGRYESKGFSCTVNASTNKPVLATSASGSTGSNKDCIFIGSRIEIDDIDQNILRVSPVIASRVVKEGLDERPFDNYVKDTRATLVPDYSNPAERDLVAVLDSSFGLETSKIIIDNGNDPAPVVDYLIMANNQVDIQASDEGLSSVVLYSYKNTGRGPERITPMGSLVFCLIGANDQRAEIVIGDKTGGSSNIMSYLDTAKDGRCAL